jgi:hypothetical protein
LQGKQLRLCRAISKSLQGNFKRIDNKGGKKLGLSKNAKSFTIFH